MTDWHSFVVLAEAGLRSDGTRSEFAVEVVDEILEAAKGRGTPRGKGSFCVVSRAQLGGGGTAASMAAALRKLIQQDRQAGLAAKKRKEPRGTSAAGDSGGGFDAATAAHDAAAARAALDVDARAGAPDRIYILHQYPANVEEAQALLSTGLDGLLDCVARFSSLLQSPD